MCKEPSTVRAYRSALRSFFDLIYGVGEVLHDKSERYLTEKRNYEEYLIKFLNSMADQRLRSDAVYFSVIEAFLQKNGIELSQFFWR